MRIETGKAVIVDLDDTISETLWRREIANFDEAHLASAKDKPLLDMIEMVNELSGRYAIVGVFPRPARYRKLTMEWLIKNGVKLDLLLMRPDDDFRPEPEMKLDLIRKTFPDLSRILVAMDDRDDVIEAYRAAGINAMQAYPRRMI